MTEKSLEIAPGLHQIFIRSRKKACRMRNAEFRFRKGLFPTSNFLPLCYKHLLRYMPTYQRIGFTGTLYRFTFPWYQMFRRPVASLVESRRTAGHGAASLIVKETVPDQRNINFL